MSELLQEIFATIRRNKLRTALTGFSVAWGIFMLIILLGSGNGLKHGVMSNFEDLSINSGSIWTGWTSMPYGGYQSGRRIRMDNADLDMLKKHPNVDGLSGRISVYSKQISLGREFASTRLTGIEPIYASTQGIKILEGRFVNESDMREARKVIVVNENTAATLSPKRSPVGLDVMIDGVVYKVVGIYKSRFQGNSPEVYTPLTTVQSVYAQWRYLEEIIYTVNGIDSEDQNNLFEEQVRTSMASLHKFDASDRGAVYIWSAIKMYMQTMMIFNGISMLIWIIGLGTLMTGIVGVSNIMLVTVRERTSEFGIRKAMGATPASLVKLILVESVLITSAFGYIGMMLGIGVMELVNMFLQRSMEGAEQSHMAVFLNPTLDLSVVFSATLVLIVAGVIAGYIPARRAVQIKTIDAMRHNK